MNFFKFQQKMTSSKILSVKNIIWVIMVLILSPSCQDDSAETVVNKSETGNNTNQIPDTIIQSFIDTVVVIRRDTVIVTNRDTITNTDTLIIENIDTLIVTERDTVIISNRQDSINFANYRDSVETAYYEDSVGRWIDSVRTLRDQAAVRRVIKAYALSIDIQDWELHRSLFTETHMRFENNAFVEETIQARIDRLDELTNRYAWTQHLASIYSIENDNDNAFVVSTLNARFKGQTNDGSSNTQDFLETGVYHYWLRRTNDGWKIHKLRAFTSSEVRELN